MPVTIVAEDGTGLANANSYASLADAQIYFNARLHQTNWSTAFDDDDRSRALIMATAQIDYQVLYGGGWKGTRIKSTQALDWPRAYAPDPDPINPLLDPAYLGTINSPQYLAPNAVPRTVKDATYEEALALLIADRTTDPEGQGLTALSVGPISLTFDKGFAVQRRPLTDLVRQMLAPLMRSGGAGVARIVRT